MYRSHPWGASARVDQLAIDEHGEKSTQREVVRRLGQRWQHGVAVQLGEHPGSRGMRRSVENSG
jgi:hypothetical protein